MSEILLSLFAIIAMTIIFHTTWFVIANDYFYLWHWQIKFYKNIVKNIKQIRKHYY